MKLLMSAIAAGSSLFTAYCSPPADSAPKCEKWLTEQQVIEGALIAAPPCEYNISWTTPERCEMWGGTFSPLGCLDIDQRLAVSVWVGGP